FVADDDRLLQRLHPPAKIHLSPVDLVSTPPSDRHGKAEEIAIEEVRRVFDLAQHPLWRVLLLRLEPEEHLFIWTMHHIITDGWSVPILMRELGTLYEAEVRNAAPTLPPLP